MYVYMCIKYIKYPHLNGIFAQSPSHTYTIIFCAPYRLSVDCHINCSIHAYMHMYIHCPGQTDMSTYFHRHLCLHVNMYVYSLTKLGAVLFILLPNIHQICWVYRILLNYKKLLYKYVIYLYKFSFFLLISFSS